MADSKSGTWIGGAAAGAAILLVATWFLGVSPQHAAAADADTQRDSAEAQNTSLETDVAKLKDLFSHLDDYKAQQTLLDAQIPVTGQTASLGRQISAAADANGVVITTLTFGAGAAVTITPPPAAAPAATQPSDGSTPAPTDSPSPSPSPTDAAAGGAASGGSGATPVPTVDGLLSVPVQVSVVGTYPAVANFVAAVQGLQRVVLVSGIALQSQPDAEASAGRPKTSKGDLEAAITGVAYVLPRVSATPTPVPDATAAPTAPALPPTVPGKNSFVPVAGDH